MTGWFREALSIPPWGAISTSGFGVCILQVAGVVSFPVALAGVAILNSGAWIWADGRAGWRERWLLWYFAVIQTTSVLGWADVIAPGMDIALSAVAMVLSITAFLLEDDE